MWPVSDAFLRILRGSHEVQSRVRVVTTWQTGVNPTGTGPEGATGTAGEIDVYTGDVKFDATADVRATLDMTTTGAGWDPRPGFHPLQPYGSELFVERGVATTHGSFEWVPLGYFRIQSVQQDSPPSGVLTIAGSDRMQAIVDAQLTAPRQFPAATTISGVFQTLVREVYPQAVISFDDATGNQTLGRSQAVDQDRHAFLLRLATSNGKIMYWDAAGILQVKTAPDPTVPVWDVDAGRDGVLISAQRTVNRDGVFNAVVAEGEAPDGDQPAVRAVVWDSNPLSPTYFNGPFGKVPTFISNSIMTNSGQCVIAARALLQRSLGLPYNVDFQAIPNPALEPYDPIRVKYSDRSSREAHVIDTLTVDLTAAGAMSGTTRELTSMQLSTGDDSS